MSKLVSYDAIFAALTVVAIGGGCAKKDEAPKATAEAVTAAASAAPPVATASAPGAVSDPAAPLAVAPALVDAGVEGARKLNAAPPAPVKKSDKGSAACGAGTCGSDMKK